MIVHCFLMYEGEYGHADHIAKIQKITPDMHNIIQIHNNDWQLCKMFLTFNMNDGIFCKILSIPQNNVMDMNNVMG